MPYDRIVKKDNLQRDNLIHVIAIVHLYVYVVQCIQLNLVIIIVDGCAFSFFNCFAAPNKQNLAIFIVCKSLAVQKQIKTKQEKRQQQKTWQMKFHTRITNFMSNYGTHISRFTLEDLRKKNSRNIYDV